MRCIRVNLCDSVEARFQIPSSSMMERVWFTMRAEGAAVVLVPTTRIEPEQERLWLLQIRTSRASNRRSPQRRVVSQPISRNSSFYYIEISPLISPARSWDGSSIVRSGSVAIQATTLRIRCMICGSPAEKLRKKKLRRRSGDRKTAT